ncbi:hypothetical protein EWM64_g9791 [Hericium alpestre]|uniref:Uncharacterized protein n=1 Tax=Hericium alpestre TaxID=135208 RepID=A0A4Y9ZJ64_9AGAM|nr:hypothetical protein EWM64_g9791 [Hericium alpestre]
MPPRKTNTPVTPRNKPLIPKRVLPRQGGLINDPLPDTLGPTPIKSGLSTTDGCVFLKDVVNPQLKEDINRNMQGLLDVEEFVKSVWGFDDADLNFNNWTYQPPTGLHDMYKVPDEKARYTPFCDMLVDAFNQWRKAVGLVRKRTVKLVRNPDKKTIRGYAGWFGKQNERRPDVVGEGMAGLLGKEISTFAGVRIWNGMPIVGEFKRWYLAELKRKAKSGLPMSAPELSVPAMASSSGARGGRKGGVLTMRR